MKVMILLVGVLTVFVMSAVAEIPQMMNYQGRLSDDSGSPVADGNYTLYFHIYGSESGTDTIWSSGGQTVTAADGLFTYPLGSNVPFSSDLFYGPERYLGITVGTDSEISPRTRLTSNAYAFHARKADTAEFVLTAPGNFVEKTGDTLSGSLVFDGAGNGMDGQIQVGETFSNIFLYNEGSRKAALYGQGYGSLILSDDGGINTVFLNARYNKGGSIRLRDNTGTDKVVFDAELTGDSAAILPTGSISSTEIFNEPGITSSEDGLTKYPLTFSFSTLAADTMTIPAPGYVFVIGGCSVGIDMPTDSTDMMQGVIQIDTAGGAGSNYSMKTLNAMDATRFSEMTPVTVFRTYYFATAGTYIFQLEGANWSNYSNVYTNDNQISCIYFSTAYGSIPSGVSQPLPDVMESNIISTANSSEKVTAENTSIKDLELIAKQAKIEEQAARIRRLEAELELKEAKEQLE
ncbi:MAG: hypothetical protein KAR42_03230 [candidate division Zixibacteria bacterium]|nr:hypothetical protein [candidate division Zixibacteria bacterium]